MKATEIKLAYQKEYRQKNRQILQEKGRAYYLANRKKAREYYLRNRERILDRRRKYYETHKLKIMQYQLGYRKSYYFKRKIEVLSYYSSGANVCAHCGFDDIRALSIDHIDGGGTKHRKEIKGDMYDWLKRNNYPKGYQVLCMNCQFIKRVERRESK